MVWYGLVWSGLVWSGLVWSVLVWSGMVWYGMVCMYRVLARVGACSAEPLVLQAPSAAFTGQPHCRAASAAARRFLPPTTAEPSWHRRARRVRSADRILLALDAARLRRQRHHKGGMPRAMSMPHRDPTRDRSASAEVLAACGKLGMVTRLSLARLRLLGPVVQHGPQAIHRLFDYLVARGCGWPALIVGDLDLVHLNRGEGLLGAGVAALPAWVALARGDPGLWLRGFARVERRATAAHVDECLRVVWRRTLDGILYQGCLALPEGSAVVEVERGFLCYDCGCAPATVGAWRTHQARVHGARHPARALAFGTACSGCCAEFHTRPRLLWHLMYSVPACLAAYASFFDPCDDATVDVAEQSDRAESRALRKAGEYDRVAKMPAVRIHGCALPPAAQVLGGEAPGVLPPRVPVRPSDLLSAVPSGRRWLCTGTWMPPCTMSCISSLARGVLEIIRIGWTRLLL